MHADAFKNMKSIGTALKKKKKQRYLLKGDATYHDVKGQNAVLSEIANDQLLPPIYYYRRSIITADLLLPLQFSLTVSL